MSNLLRSEDPELKERVRSLRAVLPDPQGLQDAPTLELVSEELRQLRVLEAHASTQNAEIARLTEAVDAAYLRGQQDGRRAGLKEASDDAHLRLAALERAAKNAIEAWRNTLDELGGYSALLSREALAKVFGDNARYREMVDLVLHHQLSAIDRALVIEIEVSTKDFHDQLSLEALVDGLASPGLRIKAVQALEAGDCRIKLDVGALEVGPRQQWAALERFLEEIASSGSR